MSVQWTDAQRSAIEDEGGALLVSAAAGSGKTAVLVERAVRMITREEHPIPADRLLILTFTNAAAQELASRIGARLEQEMRTRGGDMQLKKQRMLLRRAFIGTVDAFCQQLVREHFAVLDLPSDIAVGEAALLEQLAADVMADVMERMYEDEAFGAFAALYGRARSDRMAEQTVRELYDYTRTLPAPGKQLARFAAMYEDAVPLAESVWGRELLAYAETALAEAESLTASALELAWRHGELAAYLPALQGDAAALVQMSSAVGARHWDDAYAAVWAHDFARLPAVRGEVGGAKAQLQLWRQTVKDIVDELKRNAFICTGAEYHADMQKAAPMIQALVKAATLFGEGFYAAKRDEKVLDFNDFEHLALGLLQTEDGERTPLAEQLSARYDAVMVDEYQDTNELQNALYGCFARADGSNLFYVGDVKQSIYRFRKANPGIFLQKKASWAPLARGAHPAQVVLGHNFRSAPAVVDGVNYLFERLMSEALGEVCYDEDERLIAGGSFRQSGRFELQMLQGGIAAEAVYVAQRIADMVQSGVQVEGEDGLRPCGYGDFCILLRSRAHMAEFVQALEQRGIPSAADTSDSLLETPEAAPLVAALCAIDNPGDDVMLAAAMLGPLFRFTADELAALRAEAPKGRLWGAVAQSDASKTKHFAQELLWYRALAGELPVGRLCEVLLDRTGYLAAVAAMEGGAARRENLLRLVGWATEVGAAARGGLASFVRLLNSGSQPAAPKARLLPGHVNLLSIHKSKGLEFPVVFLADANHQFNLSDLNRRVQLHAELGIGITLRNADVLYPTLPLRAIRRRGESEALSEEMRLLYVALTRAKEQVIVTFAHGDPARLLAAKLAALEDGQCTPFILGRQRSMAAWLLCALLGHADSTALLAQAGLPAPAAAPHPARFTLGWQAPEQQAPPEKQRYRLSATPDPEWTERLAEQFGQVPLRRQLAGVPAKLSVSALSKPEGEGIRRRPSFMYTKGLTAAERGTAQHAFLQYADFAAAKRDLPAEVARLVRDGFLEQAQANALDAAGLSAFFASPLYRRMEAARQLLREYDFITAVPATLAQPELGEEFAGETVLVQGIADAVLVADDGVEIADYKTDHGVDADTLAARYAPQLRLYRMAVERRLQKPVRRLTIWSFALGREVDVPL